MSKVIGVVLLVLMAVCGQASAQSAEQLEQACARKDFVACNNLGLMYEKGEGVRQHTPLADEGDAEALTEEPRRGGVDQDDHELDRGR